jgi:solute carrier family 13 (sodium-dependent dicarboxylate transporter), member 2/3/5
MESSPQARIPQIIPLILGPLFAILIWLTPFDIPSSAKMTAGIIVWVASWWLSPLVPLHVSGLVGLMLAHFFGVAPWPELLRSFADPIIFLFMGGFFLAQAVEYHQLDKWMIQATLANRRINGNSRRLFIALVFLTAGMSAFLSNTATAALVLPVAGELIRRNGDNTSDSTRLLLLIAAAASIGGTMTPVGSPPNMIGLGLMEKILGHRPSFLTWVKNMVPLSLSLLLVMLWIYRKELKTLSQSTGLSVEKIPLNNPQRLVAAILFITAFLWALPGLTPIFGSALTVVAQRYLPESVVAIGAGITLMLIPTRQGPLLPWSEAKKIDWATLMLFGSGLALGDLAFRSGLASIMASQIEAISHFPAELLLALAVIVTLFLTELVSNTATANLILPVLLSSAAFVAHPEKTVFAIVAAANLAFMLPVGTPPNALVYATGKVSISTMVKKGILGNLAAGLIIILFSLFIFS